MHVSWKPKSCVICPYKLTKLSCQKNQQNLFFKSCRKKLTCVPFLSIFGQIIVVINLSDHCLWIRLIMSSTFVAYNHQRKSLSTSLCPLLAQDDVTRVLLSFVHTDGMGTMNCCRRRQKMKRVSLIKLQASGSSAAWCMNGSSSSIS